MAKGKRLTEDQVNIIAKCLVERPDLTQAQICELAGLPTNNAGRTCGQNVAVLTRVAELKAQKKPKEINLGMSLIEKQDQFEEMLLEKLKEPELKEEVRVRYYELYGKRIKAFTDKVEVEGSISLADVLNKRRKDKS